MRTQKETTQRSGGHGGPPPDRHTDTKWKFLTRGRSYSRIQIAPSSNKRGPIKRAPCTPLRRAREQRGKRFGDERSGGGGSQNIHFVAATLGAKPSQASTRGSVSEVGGGSEREEARRVVLEPYYWPARAAGQRRVGFTAMQVRRRGKYARRCLVTRQ